MPPVRLSWAYVSALRPLQWTKNLLVFAALLFARQAGDPGQVRRAAVVFVSFCLISSALYLFNDVLDRSADRRHPLKKTRPVASGAVHWEIAAIMAMLLAAAGLLAGRSAAPAAVACVLGYLALGVAYSLALKRMVIIDILAIAGGFVLRAVAGACAIGVTISPWLLICTMLLALFLATAKRRHELLSSARPQRQRPVLAMYSPGLLDQMIAAVTSSTIMAYVLYAFSERTRSEFPSGLMPLTVPFVLYGIFRYLYLIYRKLEGGDPEAMLFRDRPLLAGIVLYALAVFLVISR